MEMKRMRVAASAIALVGLLALGACASNDDMADTGSTAPVAAAEQAPPPPPPAPEPAYTPPPPAPPAETTPAPTTGERG